MSTRENVRNLIKLARESNSFGVKTEIHNTLKAKIKEALDKRSIQLAKGLFNGKEK